MHALTMIVAYSGLYCVYAWRISWGYLLNSFYLSDYYKRCLIDW